ncbi:MAG: hypothetical protein SFW35_01010 [Chitinophagales bacterium]|nr:hypothetical protein [Chitinophagales bacterium]
MLRLAHIINPVQAPIGSELQIAQPITFQTMVAAQAFAKGIVDVGLYTVQFEEDKPMIPPGFQILPNLERSVLQVGSFQNEKKLPLLGDILESLYKASDAEYLIYTNVDIALMPFFYTSIASLIAEGYDAFAINRRRLSSKYQSTEDIPLMYADIGRPHPGFDCFVFKKNLYPKFLLGNICIGIPFIEATMMYNLAAHAERFRLFGNMHLTMHIGLEVMPARDKEYYWHNRKQFNQLIKELKPSIKSKNLPYAEQMLLAKILKWGLNPGTFIKLNMEVEGKTWLERMRFRINELRFRMLQRY